MLGLPESTEMNRPMPKKAIFDRFKLSSSDRQRFDSEIRRLAIVNEVSPSTTNIIAGESTGSFYVVLVSLRSAECDKKSLVLLSKLIPQNMLFMLEYNDTASLAVYRADRVIQSEWKPLNEWEVKLTGLNLDTVWENVISQIGGLEIAEGSTLDEQIEVREERARLLQRIERLEKQARSEKQPRRKWELVEEVRRLKEGVEGENGRKVF
jgi:hypothetical protein